MTLFCQHGLAQHVKGRASACTHVHKRRYCKWFQPHRGTTLVVHAQLNSASKQAHSPQNTVVTDEAVPEGHKGLHGFLYGDGGAEKHDAVSAVYEYRQGEDDGTTLISIPEYLETRDATKPIGVYALYNNNKQLQYIGYSRNMVLAVKAHLSRAGAARCAYVRPMVFANKAMQSRGNLEREVQNWIAEAGTVPPGNSTERELWDGKSFDTSSMSSVELAEYEEKKIKLRKAMGENLHDAQAGETADAAERRLKMIKAVEGDDWSEVISEQTQQTVSAASSSSQQPADSAQPQHADSASQQSTDSSPPVVSPFSKDSVTQSLDNAAAQKRARIEMTVESVDRALETVRPYLIADGGNVEVVGVEDGNIFLRLDGACSSCPSSSATMKMGIERALRDTFGDQVKEIMQVGGMDMRATAEAVDMHLNMIRSALANFGGKVEVVSVENGIATLRYKGIKPLGNGVIAAVKERFPDLHKVILVDFPE